MFQTARRRLIWPFLLPQAVLYTIFTFAPIVATVILAFTNWHGVHPIRFIGPDNFRRIAADLAFRVSVGNSIYYVVAGTGLLFVPATFLAVGLSQPIRARPLFRFLILAPAVLSISVAGLMWKWMFHPVAGLIGGPLSAVGRWLGVEPLTWGLLRNSGTALTLILLVHLWHTMGTWVLLLLAGLKRLPPELADAARVDGASERQVLFHITLPLMWDLERILLLLWLMTGLQAFSYVYIMGRTSVMATHVYAVAFRDWNWAYGMALATAMMTLIFGASQVANRALLRETVEY
jgi:ABC-type sugar transport system permease subunit